MEHYSFSLCKRHSLCVLKRVVICGEVSNEMIRQNRVIVADGAQESGCFRRGQSQQELISLRDELSPPFRGKTHRRELSRPPCASFCQSSSPTLDCFLPPALAAAPALGRVCVLGCEG